MSVLKRQQNVLPILTAEIPMATMNAYVNLDMQRTDLFVTVNIYST